MGDYHAVLVENRDIHITERHRSGSDYIYVFLFKMEIYFGIKNGKMRNMKVSVFGVSCVVFEIRTSWVHHQVLNVVFFFFFFLGGGLKKNKNWGWVLLKHVRKQS